MELHHANTFLCRIHIHFGPKFCGFHLQVMDCQLMGLQIKGTWPEDAGDFRINYISYTRFVGWRTHKFKKDSPSFLGELMLRDELICGYVDSKQLKDVWMSRVLKNILGTVLKEERTDFLDQEFQVIELFGRF